MGRGSPLLRASGRPGAGVRPVCVSWRAGRFGRVLGGLLLPAAKGRLMAGESAPRLRRCVVIGAGVLGVCVAARLAEAGIGVTLLEQAEPGRAATRSSFAWLNSNDKMPRAYHDLNHAGMRAWAGLSASLGGAAWYRPAGNIEWAATAAGRAQLAARVARLAAWATRPA